MDARSNRLLNILLKSNSSDIDYLSKSLTMSKRLVRNLIKELNNDLKTKQLPPILVAPSGHVSFEKYTDKIEYEIRQFILDNNYYTYRLTPNERKTILIIILLSSNGYRTSAELSNYLQTSRNTIINDMNDLKTWFSENKMKLLSQVQKGYCVEGQENDIRKAILKLIELNLDYSNYTNTEPPDAFQHLLLNELQYKQKMHTIRNVIKEEEVRHGLYFSDFSFMEVAFELLILCKRLSMHRKLAGNMSDKIKNSSKYPLSKDILEKLQQLFDIEISEAEKKNFTSCLRRKSYVKNSTKKNLEKPIIPIIISQIIYRISRHFNISFYLDFGLYDMLVDHMKSAIYRTQIGEYLEYPFDLTLEKKYADLFRIVKDYIAPLEKYIGHSFKKNELAFIVMYFATLIERRKTETIKGQKASAILISKMGRGTLSLLQEEIKKLADVIEIIDIKPAHEAMHLNKKEIDMIISIGPYKNNKIPHVQIESPILKKIEIYKIRMLAMALIEKKWETKLDSKTSEKNMLCTNRSYENKTVFISANRIRLDIDALTQDEAIKASGHLLHEAGMITHEYIEAMVENAKINSTHMVICPGLAIPHAEAEKGTLQEGISLVRLKKPICFGNAFNDPVLYVAALSILRADSINTILYRLACLFNNAKWLEEMNSITSAPLLYEFIISKI